ncbi:hypothetical protein IE53DRAFT_124970 [Violaceomyces palustris]|uniref:Uncharacterized protein n=1 Tax=Violaceomyces palustris TaxID=1673888 RepID=A0ACD0NVI6_9BASI|nr:hypothetical protein IE53DRAFT_124970 [Violaceomyces palustris]
MQESRRVASNLPRVLLSWNHVDALVVQGSEAKWFATLRSQQRLGSTGSRSSSVSLCLCLSLCLSVSLSLLSLPLCLSASLPLCLSASLPLSLSYSWKGGEGEGKEREEMKGWGRDERDTRLS